MFQILQLDNGRYVIRNFLGGFVNKDGVVRTFRSPKKAQKYIDKWSRSMTTSMNRLNKSRGR